MAKVNEEPGNALLKDTHKSTFLIDGYLYNIVTKFYVDDQLQFEAENFITKEKYFLEKSPKEIMELTRYSKFEITSENFLKIFLIGLTQKDPNLKLLGSYNEINKLITLSLTWMINMPDDNKITREFVIALDKVHQEDVDRMGKMMFDFHSQKNLIENSIKQLEHIGTLTQSVKDLHIQFDHQSKRIDDLFSPDKHLEDQKTIKTLSDSILSLQKEFKSYIEETTKVIRSLTDSLASTQKNVSTISTQYTELHKTLG